MSVNNALKYADTSDYQTGLVGLAARTLASEVKRLRKLRKDSNYLINIYGSKYLQNLLKNPALNRKVHDEFTSKMR